mgnify:CR=1 FL=1
MHDSLQFVPADELHDYWAFVRDGLGRVLEKGGGRWLPEDIYHLIKSGSAFLHVAFESGAPAGFFVLQEAQDWDAKTLHILAAYSSAHGDIFRHQATLMQFAKNAGAKRLTFASPRLGWVGRAPKHGFEIGQTFYSLPIESEH